MDKPFDILIIDDDDVDRRMVARAIKGTAIPHQITEADSANLGIKYLSEANYDCVFLDYLLPGTDGLALLNKVRGLGIKTPIVVVTSQGDEKIAVEMMKSGASDYVIKTNINASEIAKVLRNTVRLREVEQKREIAEQALKISEARLAEAQKIARIGNWEVDMAKQTLYWSDELFAVFDVSKEIYIPDINSLFDFFLAEDRPKVEELFGLNNSGVPFHIDVRIKTRNGALKYVNLQGYYLYNNDSYSKVVGTLQDITDRKLVEQELIVAKQMAEELIKVKEQFLAHMSHEIRTPMNAIIGFTKLMMQQSVSLSGEQQKYLEAINHSGENLLVIINDILDFSKINSGKFSLEHVDLYLPEVTEPIIDIFQPKADEKSIRLVYEIDKSMPLKFKGDPVRLSQILVNLLGNAVKFTEKGFIRLGIGVAQQDETHAMLVFSVEDTGIGIPEDKLNSIFESFTQASSDTTRKYGGTGLGLTIVKSLVEMQGGTINVTSTTGLGTTFTIRIPFEKADFVIEGHRIKKESDASSNFSLKNVKILLVEDNEMNQFLSTTILNKQGCLVDIAQNGLVALDVLQKKSYDLVLMDIQMPEMDGYETSQVIRQDFPEPVRSIPIIAMTAHALQSELDRCLKCGMNDYVTKPFENHVLYEKIRRLLKKESLSLIDNSILTDQSTNDGLLFNLDYLHYSFPDNKDYVKELLTMFVMQMPDEMKRLHDFFSNKEWDTLRKQSHKMKSSYGMIGAVKLQENMKQIEYHCGENNVDFLQINQLIDDSAELNHKLINELQTMLNR